MRALAAPMESTIAPTTLGALASRGAVLRAVPPPAGRVLGGLVVSIAGGHLRKYPSWSRRTGVPRADALRALTAGGCWSVPGRPVAGVGRFQRGGLVVGQGQVERSDGFGQMVRSGRADDRGGDGRVAQHPGQRASRPFAV